MEFDPSKSFGAERGVDVTGISFGPVVCRLIWPSEMDLMDRIAGLRLVERWGGWQRQPFTAESSTHVSVYRRG